MKARGSGGLILQTLSASKKAGTFTYILELLVLAILTLVATPSLTFDYFINPLAILFIFIYQQSISQKDNINLGLGRMKSLLATFLVATILSVFEVVPVTLAMKENAYLVALVLTIIICCGDLLRVNKRD